MAPRRRKTWKEKLHDDKDLPKVIEIDDTLSKRWGEGTCVIPAPREVDGLMAKVGRGALTTINAMRERLAQTHGAAIACPITTGIFARIAAEAAAEDEAAGQSNVTPYWRALKADGEINPKYPGGIEGQRRRLEAEGHAVVQKGKRWLALDYETNLTSFSSDA